MYHLVYREFARFCCSLAGFEPGPGYPQYTEARRRASEIQELNMLPKPRAAAARQQTEGEGHIDYMDLTISESESEGEGTSSGGRGAVGVKPEPGCDAQAGEGRASWAGRLQVSHGRVWVHQVSKLPGPAT